MFLNLKDSSDKTDPQFSVSDINKFVFLFRGVNWGLLQEFFRKQNIAISGGSGSKRVFLSSSNFFLSNFLSSVGYGAGDIYDSFSKSKDLDSFDIEVLFFDEDITYMKEVITNIVKSDLMGSLKRKNELESKIFEQKSKLDKTATRFAGFGSLSEKDSRKNQNKLNSMREEIQEQSKDLSKIESEIVQLQEEEVLLKKKNLSFDTIFALYKARYNKKNVENYVLGIKENLKHFNKNNHKSVVRSTTFSNKRSYSTNINRGNSQSFENSNVIIEKKDILPKNILGEFKELYDNDPMVTLIKNIMLSDLSNYEKQINIERNISEFWENQLYKKLSSENSLFSNKYGIGILLKNIEKTKRHLEDYINKKTYMKNKWYKNYILCIESEILISIVISNLIPFVVKYMSSNDHNSITILEKIGKKIIKNVFKSE